MYSSRTQFNYAYADGHLDHFYPLDTDPRDNVGGTPGMYYGQYWLNNSTAWYPWGSWTIEAGD